MSRAILFLVIIFVLTTSACGPVVPATSVPLPTQALPELDETWTLKMSHSGGIMGLSRSIEISSDGTYTVTDERKKNTIQGQLSAGDRAKLADLIASSFSNQQPGRPNGACADCFIYAIEFNDGNKTLTAQVDDTTIAESGLEPLVTFLRGIIDESLQ